jgi:regulator of sirC expression with transglutaminase-like and TPR domain
VIDAFIRAATGPEPDLATSALLLARIEHPCFDPAPYLKRLNDISVGAKRHMASASGPGQAGTRARANALSSYLFTELGFSGNTKDYNDPRNSFLHDVLDRHVGIPVSLSVLYIEVARRAGLAVEGVNFPGHFLVRSLMDSVDSGCEPVVIDPFHGGIALSIDDCVRLLPAGMAGDGAVDRVLRTPTTTRQILVRMLHNLKGVYVRMRSFPQARTVTDMLIALDPTAIIELRDRGLLAYHLNDLPAALHDLEHYLSSPLNAELDQAAREEHERVFEHVKVLRRRVAELN